MFMFGWTIPIMATFYFWVNYQRTESKQCWIKMIIKQKAVFRKATLENMQLLLCHEPLYMWICTARQLLMTILLVYFCFKMHRHLHFTSSHTSIFSDCLKWSELLVQKYQIFSPSWIFGTYWVLKLFSVDIAKAFSRQMESCRRPWVQLTMIQVNSFWLGLLTWTCKH